MIMKTVSLALVSRYRGDLARIEDRKGLSSPHNSEQGNQNIHNNNHWLIHFLQSIFL